MINIWLSGLLTGLGITCVIQGDYKTAVVGLILAIANLYCGLE